MSWRPHRAPPAAALIGLVALLGCGGPDPEVTTPPAPVGTLVVSTGAEAGHEDPDGYDLVIDGETVGRVEVEETRVLELAPGPHTVALGDVQGDCAVEGSAERIVEVVEGGTSEARFVVDCLFPIEDGIVLGAIPSDLAEDGSAELWVQPAEGAAVPIFTGIEPGEGLVSFALSPDGRQVAFETRAPDADAVPRLWLVDVDGSGARVIAEDAGAPTWAPDSDAIAFQRPDEEGPDIWLVDIETGLESALPTRDGAREPAFSPDGTELAYVVTNLITEPQVDLEYHIEVLTLSGGAIRQITTYPEEKSRPAWSPDGSHVVYDQFVEAGRRDLWIATTADADDRPLTNSARGEIAPFWSPDGDRIVWTQFTSADGSSIATVSSDLEGRSLELLWAADQSDAKFFLPFPESAGAAWRPAPRPISTSRLVNGSGDTCTLEGWTAGPGPTIDAVELQEQGATGPVVEPAEGPCFFSFAVAPPPGDDHAIVQAGAVEDGEVLLLSGYFRTRDFEYATVTLSLADGSTPLADATSGAIRSSGWETFQLVAAAPPDADRFELELRGHLETGSFTNVYFDAVELAAAAGR